MFKNKDDLIQNLKYYYEKSLDILYEFGGPSIYFHVQCIREKKQNFLSDRHIELIYATLTAWGMHRMGDPKTTKTKLVELSIMFIISREAFIRMDIYYVMKTIVE